jgi:hypothetical protein
VPVVLPAGGAPEVSANLAGVTVSVMAEPWPGSPYDLGDYLTPVALEFYNAGPNAVRVSYLDLVLTDETGRRYAAINPFAGAPPIGLTDEKSDPDDKPLLLNEHLVLVAGRGGGGWHGGGGFRGGGVRYVAPRRGYGGARIGAPPGFRRGYGYRYGAGYGGFRGYSPYGHYRGWYGPHVRYWGAPWFAPPGYATWVWAWSPTYYPAEQPPDDVLALGLPEGVLQPGGRASGYVYFQRATDRSSRLLLTWQGADGNTGAPLGTAPLPLEVSR